MKKINILFLLFFIFSCANIRHATNINVQKVKSYKNNPEREKKLNANVRIITPVIAKSCKHISKASANDNVFDSGKKYAVLYLKQEAQRVGGNAIVITKEEKFGSYGHRTKGLIFHCKFKQSQS